MIKTAGAAIAGVLTSTAVLPGGALAAAKPDPARKGNSWVEVGACGEESAAGLFMLPTPPLIAAPWVPESTT